MPPGGGGRVRCYPQLPTGTFAQIVEHVIAADPGFVVVARGVPRRQVTDEGEYGVWVELSGHLGGEPARRWIGAILLDSFVMAIDAMSVAAEADATIAAQARTLFEKASFGLGARRRRFVYRRPPGWQSLATGLIATWYPPDYPRHRAQIIVYPAEPSGGAAADVFAELLEDEERRGFARAGQLADEPFAWRLFTGHHYRYRGRWPDAATAVDRDAIVLADGRYYYVLRLESMTPDALDADRAVLRDLTDSVEPLPHPGAGGLALDLGQLAELSGPWAE